MLKISFTVIAKKAVLLGLVGGMLLAEGARASDYSQFRGPNRDGRAAAEETGLLQEWPEGGPALLWKAEGLGRGYSHPVCAGGVIYITGELDNDLALSALDAQTGETLWRQLLPGEAWHPNEWPGARGTPTYDAETNRLFLLTARGTLSAYDATDGKHVWSRNIKEWGRGIHEWGFAESPLIAGNRVIFTPGGPNAISAVDKHTGEDIWKSAGADRPPHYSSPILVRVGARTLVVNGTAHGLMGVDLETGEVAFTNDFSAGQNCTTPLYDEESGLLFWANGYGKGGITLSLSEKDGAVIVEERSRIEAAQVTHGGYVRVDSKIYACSDRGLMCLSPADGQVLWNVREVGPGSIHYADGRLYCYRDSGGVVVLVQPDAGEFRERGRFTVPGNGPGWAYPVVSGKRLLIRYGDNSDVLYAFDVAAE